MHQLDQKTYLQLFEKESLEEIELTKKKNTDYACDSNAFANFNLIELITDASVTTEEGILTRLSDKFIRVAHLISRPAGSHAVKDESVLDTLRDISVYAKILRIYIMTKPSADFKHQSYNAIDGRQNISTPHIEAPEGWNGDGR